MDGVWAKETGKQNEVWVVILSLYTEDEITFNKPKRYPNQGWLCHPRHETDETWSSFFSRSKKCCCLDIQVNHDTSNHFFFFSFSFVHDHGRSFRKTASFCYPKHWLDFGCFFFWLFHLATLFVIRIEESRESANLLITLLFTNWVCSIESFSAKEVLIWILFTFSVYRLFVEYLFSRWFWRHLMLTNKWSTLTNIISGRNFLTTITTFSQHIRNELIGLLTVLFIGISR